MDQSRPCPNMPAEGLQRLRGDFKQCPSPWICGELGCQINAKPPADRKRRPQRERLERINKLIGEDDV